MDRAWAIPVREDGPVFCDSVRLAALHKTPFKLMKISGLYKIGFVSQNCDFSPDVAGCRLILIQLIQTSLNNT
jgi:hypothetical protein